MLLLAALWGFQQAAIKLVAADVSLVMQAAIRSAGATVLVLAWASYRGIPLFRRDGTLLAGIAAGLLFGAEFAFIYGGLAHTNVSRMTVFVYLAPPLTALGLHFFVRGERLARAAVARRGRRLRRPGAGVLRRPVERSGRPGSATCAACWRRCCGRRPRC